MECRHLGSRLPSGLCVPCACPEHLEYHRQLYAWEEAIAETIGDLLALGWMPSSIVDEVRARSPRSSRAWMLTRVELTCVAGYWLSRPDRATYLAQADQLAKHTGFQVGTTIPGWLERWIAEKAMYDASVAERAVLHLLDATGPILDSVAIDLDLSAWPELTERLAMIPTAADIAHVAAVATPPADDWWEVGHHDDTAGWADEEPWRPCNVIPFPDRTIR